MGAAPGRRRRRRTGGPPQPQLRAGRAAQEQAQAAAQGWRSRPKGPIKERPVSRLYENDEDWRNEKPDEVEIDDIATSAKVDPEGDQDDE